MFGKATWDAVKAFFDAMKVPLIILAVILLYRYPQKIREFIDRAGFRVEEISVAGVRLAEKAAADLEGTGQKLDQVTAALAERDLLLREIAAATPEAALAARIDTLLAEGDAITTSALATAGQATIAAAEIARSLQPAPAPGVTAPPVAEAPEAGGYLIIFGADLDVDPALQEIARVRTRLPDVAGRLALFRKGSFYRSAAAFDDVAARDAARDEVATAAGRSVEPVTLARWCPGATLIAEPADGVPLYQC